MDHAVSKLMFIFPGQGAQYRGMGSDVYREFAAARQVYAQASEALGYDLAELSFHDPRGMLDTTEYTQPAVLVHSLACLAAFTDLCEGQVVPEVTGGHSLGEYSALAAAGALTVADAVSLVQRRGQILGKFGRGRMAALPLDAAMVREIASRFYCGIGGCNVPDQTVVGGAKDDLEALVAYVKEHHQARATVLNVEGAFHTHLMVTAAEHFRPCLEATPFALPRCEVLSNYTGKYHPHDAAAIRANLFFQIFYPVRWIWGMHHALHEGVGTLIEFGGGIGKGETPVDKRANLAGITAKAVKSAGREAVYHPVINVEGVKAAARAAVPGR